MVGRLLFLPGGGWVVGDLDSHGSVVADLADPRLVPARADLHGVAPAFLSAAELDPLRDAVPCYAAALRAAGVPATAIVEPGLVHAWLRARTVSSRAAAAFAWVVSAIRGFAAWPTRRISAGGSRRWQRRVATSVTTRPDRS